MNETDATDMSDTLCLENNLSKNHAALLKLSFLSTNGITSEEARIQLPQMDIDTLSKVISDLSAHNLIKFMQLGTTPMFKGVPKQEVDELAGLTWEEKLVYQKIKDSGTEGVLKKDLKKHSNLGSNAVNNCINSLKQTNKISRFKTEVNPKCVLFLAQGVDPSFPIVPSSEVTEGPWYSGQTLDEAFVKVLYEVIFKYIARLSFPTKSLTATGVGACFSADYDGYPTAKQVKDYITRIQLSNIPLSLADINSILDLLVFDGKVSRLIGGKVSGLSTSSLNGASNDDDDDDDDDDDFVEGCGISFKARVKDLNPIDTKWVDFLMDIPCDGCDIAHLCYPAEALTPEQKEQFDAWPKK